jgi:hypothetical protein
MNELEDMKGNIEAMKVGAACGGCLKLVSILLVIIMLIVGITLMVDVIVRPQRYTGAAHGAEELRDNGNQQHGDERGEEDD